MFDDETWRAVAKHTPGQGYTIQIHATDAHGEFVQVGSVGGAQRYNRAILMAAAPALLEAVQRAHAELTTCQPLPPSLRALIPLLAAALQAAGAEPRHLNHGGDTAALPQEPVIEDTVVCSIPSRPVMRYHGGKWKLGPWIISHFPIHRIYVEPYGGGGSVLLRKPRCYSEVYNDLSGEVVNVFRVLRSPAQARELERRLRLTPYSREEFDLAYLNTGDPIEQAGQTLIRAFMGFGSASSNKLHSTGFRSNANRSGTTPAHDWANYPDLVPVFVSRMRGVCIENRPALDVIRNQDRADALFYIDPPYVRSTRSRDYRACYEYEMTDGDHAELAECLHQVEGMVVLSGYPSALYDKLYGDWQRIERRSHADGGGHGVEQRTEVLWLNGAAVRQQQFNMFTEVTTGPGVMPWTE